MLELGSSICLLVWGWLGGIRGVLASLAATVQGFVDAGKKVATEDI
jgi:hypothetical protein